MCMGCVYEYVTEEHPNKIGDSLRLVVDEIAVRPAVTAAAAEVTALYQLPDCEAGGPLHVIVDDTNVDDHFLEDDAIGSAEDWTEQALAQANKVLAALRPLTRVERAVATVIAAYPSS